MAWCPICKAEYENETSCPDCMVDLMKGNPGDYTDIFTFKNEEVSLNIYNHLLDIGFETVQYYYDAASGLYHIICEISEETDAKKQLILFIKEDFKYDFSPLEKVEISKIADNIISEEEDIDTPKTYISAEEKYANVNSSAASLLIVGFIGLIVMVLDITGIYRFPFSGASRILFLGTMGFLFVLFVIMGILSFRNAKKLEKKIKEEDSLQEKIQTYITDELDLTSFDESLNDNTDPEEKYLERTEYIQSKVKESFPDTDDSFIEYIIEGLYDTLYPNN